MKTRYTIKGELVQEIWESFNGCLLVHGAGVIPSGQSD